MESEKLKKLIEHRDAILLAEIGALIHDLGKLSEEFVRSKCAEESGNWIHHTAILEYDTHKNVSYARKVKAILESIKIKLNENNVIKLYDFILGHHKKLWNMWNSKKSWNKPESFTLKYPKYNEENIFLKSVIASDTFDSEEDKSHSKDLQSICGVYKSTSFGFENEQVGMESLIEEREEVYKTIINWLNTYDFEEIVRKRRKCMNEIRKSFSKALGETRRSANDVTLLDHSYMTASIMKALVAQQILDDRFLNRAVNEINKTIKDENEKKKPKYIIKIGKPFKIFPVGWNFFDFIKQSHKIPDVIGRIEILKEIKEEIKRIVEEDFALGNSIYDDDFGIYFLIPSIIDDGDLKDVKEKIFDVSNEKVDGILLPVFHIEEPNPDEEFRIGKLLTRAISDKENKKNKRGIKEKILQHEVDLTKTPTWVKSWESSVQLSRDKLICNVCGKGYFCKGDDEEICNTCKMLRNKGRKSEAPQTIFIDEISWNPEKKRYENVCLLIAKFDLDEWLSGEFVQSLFIREPNKKDLNKLRHFWEFYQSKFYDKNNKKLNDTFIGNLFNRFGRLNAVLTRIPIDKLNQNHIENAKKEIEDWNSEFDKLDEYEKSILSKQKEIVDKIDRNLSLEIMIHERNNLAQNFEKHLKFENVRQYLENYLENLETFLEVFEDKKSVKSTIISSTNLVDALVIFQKPPSPSRLMRVWNNTKEFFESIEKEICSKVPLIDEVILKVKDFKFENPAINKLTKNRAYLIEINDLGLQGEVICEANCDNPKELTVITPHLSAVLKKEKGKVKDKEITIKDVDTKRKVATAKIEVKTKRDNKNKLETKKVRAFRIISKSPTMFIAIIPAQSSLDIINIIRKKYFEYFGKVFGKLPLHIGLIYFKKKMPIFAVLDSANRMIDEFERLKDREENLQVASDPKDEDSYRVLELCPIKEGQESFKYKVKIPYTLGDGNTDYYHPYLRVEDSSDDVVEIKLDDETIVQKHISKIKKDDKIVVKRYYLDFEFLDSNIRRFDIGEKRKHWLFADSTNKPKPYMLWDIDNFERLRNLIQKLGLTTTQIMNLYEMLMDKINEWGLKDVEKLKSDDAFKNLVESAITSIPLRLKVVKDGKSKKGKITEKDYEFLKAVILNGMFFDFVDLWHTILKKRFEEGEKDVK